MLSSAVSFPSEKLFYITHSNRPFPSSKISHFQNEANRKTHKENDFLWMRIKTHFHIDGFALSFA